MNAPSAITPENYDIAVKLTSLPDYIHCYRHAKELHLADVKVNQEVLLERFFNVGKENLS